MKLSGVVTVVITLFGKMYFTPNYFISLLPVAILREIVRPYGYSFTGPCLIETNLWNLNPESEGYKLISLSCRLRSKLWQVEIFPQDLHCQLNHLHLIPILQTKAQELHPYKKLALHHNPAAYGPLWTSFIRTLGLQMVLSIHRQLRSVLGLLILNNCCSSSL